jgi:hypothetical protein
MDRALPCVRPTQVRRLLIVVVAVLAVAGCAKTAPAPGSGTVVHGSVVAAPGCPVEMVSSPCPAIRVRGATVQAMRGDVEVAQVRTAADGSFELTLPAGTYRLVARSAGGYRSTASALVHVGGPGVGEVTITLDSGIR